MFRPLVFAMLVACEQSTAPELAPTNERHADPSLTLRGVELEGFCSRQVIGACRSYAGCTVESRGCEGRPCTGKLDDDCDPTHPGTCDPIAECVARKDRPAP